jgi:hypothetical protein
MITPGSITQMGGLSKRPVYFLNLNGSPNPSIVVKGDTAGADVSIKWGSKLMKNVNNDQVNTKILTPVEIAEFKRVALATFAAGTPQHNNASAGNYTWVKMPFVPGLSDAGFLTEDDTPKARQIKETMAKLLDSATWNQLGQVVAVDIFNGDNDRFQVLGGSPNPLGSWNNKGNLMFVAAGPTKVIGLDTYDPASDRSNLTTAGHFDELRILIDPVRRNAFALACVKDVGAELKKTFRFADVTLEGRTTITLPPPPGQPNPVTVNVAQMQDLYVTYMPNFSAGIATGADKLKTYLRGKVQQYAPPPPAPRFQLGGHRGGPPPAPAPPLKTIPQGVKDRMQFLGW